jgi:hypothetical protein
VNIAADHVRQGMIKFQKSTEAINRLGLPDECDLADVAKQVYPNGVEVYLYRGQPFLEMHSPEFEQVRTDDGGTRINIVQKYRYL